MYERKKSDLLLLLLLLLRFSMTRALFPCPPPISLSFQLSVHLNERLRKAEKRPQFFNIKDFLLTNNSTDS